MTSVEGGEWDPYLLPVLRRPASEAPWKERAACKGLGVELFYVDNPMSATQVEPGRRICQGCEVREECDAYATENKEKYGTWGGKSEIERRRRPRKAAPTAAGHRTARAARVPTAHRRGAREVTSSARQHEDTNRRPRRRGIMTEKKATKVAPKGRRYPWSEWTNGKEHTITQGKDFTVEPEVMRGQLYVRARTEKIFVSSTVDGKKVTFRFSKTKPKAEAAPKKKAPAKKATAKAPSKKATA